MQTIKSRSIAVVGAVLATFATVAAASPARAETSTTVSYAGLDLGSAAGSAILDRRIRVAAAKVCGPMDRQFRVQVVACRRDAIANAKASLPAAARPELIAAR